MKVGSTEITFVRGNITKEHVDAVVNAANSSLLGGGGVDGAIHRAGGPAILDECRRIREERGRLATGDAVVTGAGDLPAQWVIHTVGPVWRGGEGDEADLLASCYRRSLDLAREKGARTIAFPSISTGAYGYPVADAAAVAVAAVRSWAEENADSGIDEVRFVLFSEADLGTYRDAAEESS